MASSSPSFLQRLTKELECSVCLEIYTDPRTLPCLHTFCWHCLNGLAERRENQEPIACPDCRTEVALPEGGNFDAFPSAFYLNRLRDIVSTQNEGHHVLCKSCTKQNAAIGFCFDCECFICEQCQDLHHQLKITIGHRIAALSNVRDMDIQQIVGRPQLCGEPRHSSEPVKFFCETCEHCICQTCAIMTHKNHEFVNLDDAADQVKLRLDEANRAIRDGVRKLEEQLLMNQDANRKLEEEIAVAELSVQRNTQRLIEMAKRHNRQVMEELALIRRARERAFQEQKEKLERQLGQLRSVADYLDSVLKRGISGEILQAEPSVSSRSEQLLKIVEELQPVRSERVEYVTNEYSYSRVEQLTLGWVSRRRIPRSYKQVSFFGTQGFGEGQFQYPVDMAVSTTGEIAVADCDNHRVQVFSSEGQFLRKIGNHGRPNGRLIYPSGVAYDKTGKIIIADTNNARMQAFNPRGRWLRKFGRGVLSRPQGVSVTIDNNIVVGDSEAKKVFVFSPKGKLLLQFACGLDHDNFRHCHAIFYDQKYFVSAVKQVVRVFDARGTHLYDIGEGHLDTPAGLAVDANDSLLLVCDSAKHCVQVFTLDGDLVNSFDIGRPVGREELLFLYGVTAGPDERVFVCDSKNHRIQIFQPQY